MHLSTHAALPHIDETMIDELRIILQIIGLKGEQMTTELQTNEQGHQKPKVIRTSGASEAVYGLGLIGAWVYYFSHATTFLIGVLGFFKGLVWPAMLVYEMLKFLKM